MSTVSRSSDAGNPSNYTLDVDPDLVENVCLYHDAFPWPENPVTSLARTAGNIGLILAIGLIQLFCIVFAWMILSAIYRSTRVIYDVLATCVP